MSKQKAVIKLDTPIDILKKYFPGAFDKNGAFNLKKFKELININEIDISKESYELRWLGKTYARVRTFDEATTFLKEDRDWNRKPQNKNSQNLLIKGDNLEVLKHLINAYREKIKMIYIDPPYNTGNDGFIYEDTKKFTPEELSELAGISLEHAKKVLDFVNSKSNSHSAWLTFMYPRLYIARELLREDGVIFISIDDNEVAQLRLMMDEIFGEENFVCIFSRKTKTMAGDKGTGVYIQHDYVVTYAKNITDVLLLGEFRDYSAYKNPDNDPNGDWTYADPTAKSGGPNLYYPIKNPYTGKVDFPPPGRYWAFTRSTFQEYIKNGRIVFKRQHNPGERGFFFKRYKKELRTPRNTIGSLIFNSNNYMNSIGTRELRELFGIDVFNNPKPVPLILKLIFFTTSPGSQDFILDFFAGSGTTGDAVMQLNAEDGGNRKYILVQLPEPIDPKKNKTAYDFVKNELGEKEPTIFHITKERLVRAAQKIRKDIIEPKLKEKKEKLKQLENSLKTEEVKNEIKALQKEIKALESQDLGFRIFETTPIWENYDIKDKELTEQTTLLDISTLKEEDLLTLLITWKTYDGIPLTEDCREILLGDYKAFYCSENLYLLLPGWKTEYLETLIKKIDTDEKFVVSKIIIFGYNFQSKHLREISENIKNYANKKQIVIETIIRV